MARPRTAMRHIREVLRLFHEAELSHRQIAVSLRIAATTVRRYLDRAEAAGLSWTLHDDVDDAALERALFAPVAPKTVPRTPPDYVGIHRELRRKGVTLELLWMEYKQDHPEGYQYSQFCWLYQQWAGRVDVVMRHQHRAGDKLFVDYAGHTIPIYPPDAQVWQAQLFVAVLGGACSTSAIARRCARCGQRAMSSPPGPPPRSILTTTSRWTGITTRCPTSWSASGSTRGSASTPSRCSSAASG